MKTAILTASKKQQSEEKVYFSVVQPSFKDALTKLMRYCAYQERCHSEVNNKAYELGLRGEDIGEALSKLIEEDFLDEARFAKLYCRSKFRQLKWGRTKIIQKLKQKMVSAPCIEIGLRELEELEYMQVLEGLLKKYLAGLSGKWPIKREKAYKYAVIKGYEPQLVAGLLKKLMPQFNALNK